MKTLEIIRPIAVFAEDEVMLVKEIADFLNEQGKRNYALDIYKKLLDQDDLSANQQIALLEDGSKLALKTGNGTLSLKWATAAENLK